tara:strand:- start:25979 stop:27130 length:1152 start_codon:yes stop_codon:yes gene_type:complete
MNQKEAKKLFLKFINNECSSEEIQLLETFLDSYQDKDEIWPELIIGNEEAFKKESWARLKSQISKKPKKRIYPFRSYMKYVAAASILLIVSLAIFKNIGQDKSNHIEPSTADNQIILGTDRAVLTLEDGSQIALEKGNSVKTQSATSNGEKLVYKKNDNNLVSLVFNHLKVPRGGQFFIELSDGTKVWLNSETELKYPVNFIDGQTREVELVYGEAYFDVSPSESNNGTKFKVLNQSQEVEVLGTEFNIKAYKDESHIYTTLVEGKVLVEDKSKNKQYLSPNQQTNLNLLDMNMNVAEVNVKDVISWKNGVFSFKDGMKLKEIMKVISRWYDIDVVFETKDLEETRFVGIMGKDQSLEEIMQSIKTFSTLKEYKIQNKKIILK